MERIVTDDLSEDRESDVPMNKYLVWDEPNETRETELRHGIQKGLCVICDDDAFYTYKKPAGSDSREIQVGCQELYEPRCFMHHPFTSNPSTVK